MAVFQNGVCGKRDVTINMKVLINHPEFKDPGGVANYWKSLQEMFTVSTVHFIVGKRITEKGTLPRIHRLLADYWRFVGLMRKNNIDIVQLNPSLDPKSFIRDGIFALLARLYGKKTIVFFHGWQKRFELRISRGSSWIFKFFFGRSDSFIVLSDAFKKKLEDWGVKKPIYNCQRQR